MRDDLQPMPPGARRRPGPQYAGRMDCTEDAVLNSLVADCDDDREVLRRVSGHLRSLEQQAEEARELRNAVVMRLRVMGVSLAQLARDTGTTDSYLSRITLSAGAERRRPLREG